MNQNIAVLNNINVLLLKYLKNSFCIGSATALPALAPKQNPSAISIKMMKKSNILLKIKVMCFKNTKYYTFKHIINYFNQFINL